MTNEEIKKLADGYYAGNADWLNKEQEQDTKVGWRQGFAYAVGRSYSYDDMIWAFEEGIHEGKLREHYKNKPTVFSESELDYYVRFRK